MFKRRKADGDGPPWSKTELKLLSEYAHSPERRKAIAPLLLKSRTRQAIRGKLRKFRIKADAFGASYRDDKASFTRKIAAQLAPATVFEAYAGAGHQTLEWLAHADTVYAVDKSPQKTRMLIQALEKLGYRRRLPHYGWTVFSKGKQQVHIHTGDAIAAAAKLAAVSRRIEVIDLDTCGSTLPTVSTFLALLKPKHLLITHGEYHSLRFRRLDVLVRLLHRFAPANVDVSLAKLTDQIEKALKLDALRAGNGIQDSFWLSRKSQQWLGAKNRGMLRRYYQVSRPRAAADCLNRIFTDE